VMLKPDKKWYDPRGWFKKDEPLTLSNEQETSIAHELAHVRRSKESAKENGEKPGFKTPETMRKMVEKENEKKVNYKSRETETDAFFMQKAQEAMKKAQGSKTPEDLSKALGTPREFVASFLADNPGADVGMGKGDARKLQKMFPGTGKTPANEQTKEQLQQDEFMSRDRRRSVAKRALQLYDAMLKKLQPAK
jgi:hypothetical protein